MPEQRSELSRQHVNLQAVKQPALSLVAFTGTLHPAAQYRLQVTELRTDREREQEKERKTEAYCEERSWQGCKQQSGKHYLCEYKEQYILIETKKMPSFVLLFFVN